MTKGAKVRARKQFRAAGGGAMRTFTNSSRPNGRYRRWGATSSSDLCTPAGTVYQPNTEPETISRQQLRAMLRKKGKNDVMLQYGRMGADNGLFVGYDGFSRRARRRVMLGMQKKWMGQVRDNLAAKQAPKNPGLIKTLLQKLSGAKPNTLAASGIRG